MANAKLIQIVSIRMISSTVDDRDFVVREHKAIEGGKTDVATVGRIRAKIMSRVLGV